MKISFLITYYNQKEYVANSIESILRIDKPCEWEILVGDDGSTDGTIDVVQKYIEKYPDNIRLYVMPREQGKKYDSVKRASANRLNILAYSTGDFFCTLDGDDYYCDTEFVKEAIRVFENDDQVSIVAFGYKYVTNGVEGEEITLPAGINYGRVDKKKYLKSFYLHAGACVHKKCWSKERVNYIQEIGYFDDNDIVINSLNYGEMYSISKAIYAYRQTGTSIYTSMDNIEQAVLNVQGLDVDLKLIDEKYHDDLFFRNANSIITMYIWKKHIRSILGESQYNIYLNGSKIFENSLCYEILIYSTLSEEKKNNIGCLISLLVQKTPKTFLRIKIKYFLRGLIR